MENKDERKEAFTDGASINDKREKKSGKFDKKKNFRRDRNKKKSFKDDDKPKLGKKDDTNNPAWYTQTPGVADAAANINFNKPAGFPINLESLQGQGIYTQPNDVYIPNTMEIDVNLIPGKDPAAVDAVNVAMFDIYTFVRHANSGKTNYEAVDLMLYLLAIDQVYSLYAFGARAYGIIRNYTAFDRGLPRLWFEAMNLDYDDWAANAAQVRARLNIIASKINTLCYPNSLPLNQRHIFMFSDIYRDSPDSPKGQYYLFRPEGYYEFQVDETSGGYLKWQEFKTSDGTKFKASQFCDLMDGLLANIMADEDFGIMSGDILRTYGANILQVNPIPEDFTIIPVYSKEVLLQLQNMSLVPKFKYADTDTLTTRSSANIVQNGGFLRIDPLWTAYFYNSEATRYEWNDYVVDSALSMYGALINTDVEYTDPASLLVLTRLRPIMHFPEVYEGRPQIFITAAGTEVVTGLKIHKLTAQGRLGTQTIPQTINSDSSFTSAVTELAHFDYHPMIAKVVDDWDRGLLLLKEWAIDLNFYSVLPYETINALHAAAISSLYNLGNRSRVPANRK